MAFDAEREIGLVHAETVVDDADQIAAAALDRHVDAAGARVERVFDQFLDGGARPLDHLAGGDAVGQDGIEPADGHRAYLLYAPASANPSGRPTTTTKRLASPISLLATRLASSSVTASTSALRRSR